MTCLVHFLIFSVAFNAISCEYGIPRRQAVTPRRRHVRSPLLPRQRHPFAGLEERRLISEDKVCAFIEINQTRLNELSLNHPLKCTPPTLNKWQTLQVKKIVKHHFKQSSVNKARKRERVIAFAKKPISESSNAFTFRFGSKRKRFLVKSAILSVYFTSPFQASTPDRVWITYRRLEEAYIIPFQRPYNIIWASNYQGFRCKFDLTDIAAGWFNGNRTPYDLIITSKTHDVSSVIGVGGIGEKPVLDLRLIAKSTSPTQRLQPISQSFRLPSVCRCHKNNRRNHFRASFGWDRNRFSKGFQTNSCVSWPGTTQQENVKMAKKRQGELCKNHFILKFNKKIIVGLYDCYGNIILSRITKLSVKDCESI